MNKLTFYLCINNSKYQHRWKGRHLIWYDLQGFENIEDDQMHSYDWAKILKESFFLNISLKHLNKPCEHRFRLVLKYL